jgi:hypothetical protein
MDVIDRTRRSASEGVEMTSPSSRRATILALSGVTLVSAAAAPVASAMPADPVRMPPAQTVSGAPAPSPVAESPSAGGFDIASAGLGAAGGGLLVIALAGGGLVLRRPAMRRHRPAGA